MCTSPITIKNPSVHCFPGQKRFITVPCGHCPECIRQKQDDWTIRSYYEFLDAQRCGGYSYMQTLTYSPEKVPTYHGLHYHDPEHIRLYFHYLRRALKKLNFSTNCFSYFLCCEVGHNSKKHSHYHILFNIKDPNLNLDLFACIANAAWTYGFGNPVDITTRSWKTGKFRRWRSDDFVVKSAGGVRYLCKYLSKDFSRESEINNLINYYELSPSSFDVDSSKSLRRKLTPFVRSSINYGMPIFDSSLSGISIYDVDFENFVIRPKADTNITKKYRIPPYIANKLLLTNRDINNNIMYDLEGRLTFLKTKFAYEKETKQMDSNRLVHFENFRNLLHCFDGCLQELQKSSKELKIDPVRLSFLRGQLDSLNIDFVDYYYSYFHQQNRDPFYISPQDVLFNRYQVTNKNYLSNVDLLDVSESIDSNSDYFLYSCYFDEFRESFNKFRHKFSINMFNQKCVYELS